MRHLVFIERPAHHPLSFFLAHQLIIPVLGGLCLWMWVHGKFSTVDFGGTPVPSAEVSLCEGDSEAVMDSDEATDSAGGADSFASARPIPGNRLICCALLCCKRSQASQYFL